MKVHRPSHTPISVETPVSQSAIYVQIQKVYDRDSIL